MLSLCQCIKHQIFINILGYHLLEPQIKNYGIISVIKNLQIHVLYYKDKQPFKALKQLFTGYCQNVLIRNCPCRFCLIWFYIALAISVGNHLPQFLCMRNIKVFLRTCHEEFELREMDLFDPSMLFDLSNFHRVLCTLAKLSQCPKALVKNIK